MARRSQRGSVNKQQIMDKLIVGRDGAIQVCREAKIGSDEYRAADRVLSAIDDLAGSLTGDRTVFRLKNHTAGGS